METFRERQGNKAQVYQLTYKAKRMIDALYKKLNGEEEIPMQPCNNPMFKSETSFTDKVTRMAIRKMNRDLRSRKFDSPST